MVSYLLRSENRTERCAGKMFDENRLKDPGYFRENRLDPHSDHAWFASDEEYEANESALRMSLNGPWKFFHAVSADPLETAVITGSTTDCEEGPVPFEIGEDEAEEIRALAMYGVVTGRVNEMMVTGGTWLYTFETPEGEYLMTVEMYQGLLVGNDGMYSFRILRDGDE